MKIGLRTGTILMVSFLLSLTLSGYIVLEKESSTGDTDPSDAEEVKVALIVLDGGDWVPVNQLMKEDELPHLQQFMDEGVYGDFQSPAAFQPITWTRIGTGVEDVNPDAWNTDTETGRRMLNSGDVENRRIWDYLGEAGIASGVTNFFLTWPVEPIEGYMVSESMATYNNHLQYPEDTVDEEVVREGGEFEVAHATLETEEDVRFKTYGFKAMDAKQHALWRFIVPERFGEAWKDEHDEYRDEVYDEYREVDKFISEFDDDWNIIVVSSFGFTEEGDYRAESLEQFHAGNAPSGYNYPTYEGDMDPILRELGYMDYEVKIRDGDEVKDIYSSQLVNCPIDFPDPTYLNETAFLFNLCIQDRGMDADEVVRDLQQVRYQDGRRLFEDIEYDDESNQIMGVWRLYEDAVTKEKVEPSYTHQPFATYEGYEVDKAVDLQLPDGSEYRYWVGPEKSGTHNKDTHGLFLAHGPDIADRGEMPLGSFGVKDVTPTILYMYDLPIPEAMDGRPVTELFNREFNNERELNYIESSTLKEEDYLEGETEERSIDDIHYTFNSSSDWDMGKVQPGTTSMADGDLSITDGETSVDFWESMSFQIDWDRLSISAEIPEPGSSSVDAKLIYSDSPDFRNEDGDFHKLGERQLEIQDGLNKISTDDQRLNYLVNSSSEWDGGKVQPGTTDTSDDKLSIGEEFEAVDYWESASFKISWDGLVVDARIPEPGSSSVDAKLIYSDSPDFRNEDGDFHKLGERQLEIQNGLNKITVEDSEFENPDSLYYRVFFSLDRENQDISSPKINSFTVRGDRIGDQTLLSIDDRELEEADLYYRTHFSISREDPEVESPRINSFTIEGEKSEDQPLFH